MIKTWIKNRFGIDRFFLIRAKAYFLNDWRSRLFVESETFFFQAFNFLRYNKISGDYFEFGCYGARTFTTAYRESRRQNLSLKFYACDSFEGLPEYRSEKDSHPEWVAGTMAMSAEEFIESCRQSGIPESDYKLVRGFYETSLPEFQENNKETNIAFAYIDCDLYSSTVDVLDFLEKHLKNGMILAFDDYYCLSDSQPSGERVAFEEFCKRLSAKWHFSSYRTFGWHGHSFLVESVLQDGR